MDLVDSGFALAWNLVGPNGIADAVAIAKQSDVAIVVVGEDDITDGEGSDITDLNLTGKQLELVQRIQQTGTPIVVILLNGR